MAYARFASMIATPIGPVRLEAGESNLTGIWIGRTADSEASTPLLAEAAAQLAAYFEGKLRRFDLPLAPAATAEAAALRAAIASVDYGETRSYGALAKAAGSSARAMGQACARNPFPIVIPCHRVLPAGGALGPYSAGHGPETKAWLLKHEGAEEWLL